MLWRRKGWEFIPKYLPEGESRIVPYLKQGVGVITTRAHVHYVVTEYGIANLYGKNMRQRVKALIEIAHPDHRAALEEEALKRFRTLQNEGRSLSLFKQWGQLDTDRANESTIYLCPHNE